MLAICDSLACAMLLSYFAMVKIVDGCDDDEAILVDVGIL